MCYINSSSSYRLPSLYQLVIITMDNVLDRNVLINFYFSLGMSQRDIVIALALNHGLTISQRHLRRVLKDLHLCRRNYTDIVEAVQYIERALEESGRQHGYRWMFERFINHGIRIRREDVHIILSCLDPVGCQLRTANRLHRRRYYAKGPNYIWKFDGYDKLKPFGFCINGCIDGFSRHIIWLNVYFTNSDPSVIAEYYFEAINSLKGCPVFMRGDPGTENIRVKDFHNLLMREERSGNAHAYIEGTSTANQRFESFWGQLRKQCVQF